MTDQAHSITDADRIEAEVTAVIEDFRGDARATIRALVVEQEILEQRIGRLASALAFGYVRGQTGSSRPEPARS